MRAFLLAVVLAIGLAATAWAAIPDGNGAISGCYAKKGGKLRVVKSGKTCKKTERPLVWSQAGPAGPAGTPGAKGARGPKGDKGDPGEISPARSAEGFEVLDNVIERQVVELSLPAGAYLLFGTGVASNDSDAAGQVSCSVYGDMVFAGAVNQTVSAHETATFTAQRAIEVEVDDTISAWCVDPVADDAVWLGLTLTAIPVGDVVE